MAEALLSMKEVACLRGGRLLFENISIDLDPGDAAIVAGPNGVGKSSLLRVAAGLLRPAAGTVERSSRLALADEGLALDERLTLGRALGFWAKLDGARSETGMTAMGLTPIAQVPVRMLSTGQRRRAALARVIASGAPLWLLDEPSNGLDAEGRERLDAAMAEHRRNGGAILAASHLPLGLNGAATVALS